MVSTTTELSIRKNVEVQKRKDKISSLAKSSSRNQPMLVAGIRLEVYFA